MLAVPHIVRNYQMQQAMAYGFTPLEQQHSRADTLDIVGYGPSILETWRKIEHPVLSLSGAHDFLVERGIEPTWHADCDPRIHKSHFVARPRPQTVYLMASCCHPQTWQHLIRNMVRIWHADNGPETRAWLDANGAGGAAVLRPGPSIGTASCSIAKLLGFRFARFFGFESCFIEEAFNAGPSERPYTGEQPLVLTVNGVTYVTTENMKRQAEEFAVYAQGLDYELVGPGLLKAMLEQQKEAA